MSVTFRCGHAPISLFRPYIKDPHAPPGESLAAKPGSDHLDHTVREHVRRCFDEPVETTAHAIG